MGVGVGLGVVGTGLGEAANEGEPVGVPRQANHSRTLPAAAQKSGLEVFRPRQSVSDFHHEAGGRFGLSQFMGELAGSMRRWRPW
ncbi:hypothetical protein DQ354_07520 [Arthrobacter sp. AQ5-06]|nr:hypothetical protein DQ354_07520 [Arthrobacter sp. AQ5-06]